jgi:uncharacterized protein YbaP (TraB family)
MGVKARRATAAVAVAAALLWAGLTAARAFDASSTASAASATPAAPAAAVVLPADCPPPAPIPAILTGEVPPAATDVGFLWRLRRDGHVSYLYGTMHAARPGWSTPGPQVTAALKAADRVGLELDVGNPDILAGIQRQSAEPPGAHPLPAPLAARLARAAAGACVDLSQLAGMRPELQAASVSLGVGGRAGLSASEGIDLALAIVAHRWGKDVRSLETPEQQFALLVSDDPAETARNVSETLDEVESGAAERQLLRLAADWHDGRLDDLEAYATWCGCVDTPEQRASYAQLVDARNPAMAKQFAAWHAEGRTVFVAVGSLHMVGPRGLPKLLAAEGFEVERVALQPATRR